VAIKFVVAKFVVVALVIVAFVPVKFVNTNVAKFAKFENKFVVVALVIVALTEAKLSMDAFSVLNKSANRFVLVAEVIVANVTNKFSDKVVEAFTIPNVLVEFGVEDAKLIPVPDQVITPLTFESLLLPMYTDEEDTYNQDRRKRVGRGLAAR
jgi:hypothetical protein